MLYAFSLIGLRLHDFTHGTSLPTKGQGPCRGQLAARRPNDYEIVVHHDTPINTKAVGNKSFLARPIMYE